MICLYLELITTTDSSVKKQDNFGVTLWIYFHILYKKMNEKTAVISTCMMENTWSCLPISKCSLENSVIDSKQFWCKQFESNANFAENQWGILKKYSLIKKVASSGRCERSKYKFRNWSMNRTPPSIFALSALKLGLPFPLQHIKNLRGLFFIVKRN